MTFRRVFKEPLLHFFVLGVGLFLLFARLNNDALQAPDEVIVDQAQVDGLVAQFQRVWQRPPTAEEVRGLIDGWIREEILYREGVALGLDVNDTVVRRRIAQKMAFIADGAAPAEPTDAELGEWLKANGDRYRIEPVYTLQQVYFDPAQHGDELRQHLEEFASSPNESATAPAGDATLLPARLASARASEVVRTFGSDFAEALAGLPVGDWQGPVVSAYGLHLVKIDEATPGRQATLEEARAALERDWSAAQSEEMNEAFYQAVRGRYTVRMDSDITGAAGPVSSGVQ